MQTEAAPRSFWQHVLGSLRGEHHDFTKGPLSTAVLLLAVPMVLEMALESTFALVDIWWVNKIDEGWFGATPTGGAAVAAIGMTEGMLSIVYAIAFGLGMAVTAMVARRVGEKDLPGATTAAQQAIGLGIAVGLLIGLPCAIWAPDLLALMSTEGSNAPAVGAGYARWIFASTPIITLLFLQNAIFRGAGDPMLALKVLALSNLLNLVLDPLFIFGIGPFPALGVEGAAVATCIGRTTAVLFQCWLLARGKCRVPMPALVRFDLEPMLRLIRLSAGTIGQFLIGTTSWLFLTKLVNLSGDAAGAGYTTAIRILMFALLPAWGLSNAAATLVGQNLGAKLPDRAEAAVWLTARYDVLFLALVTVVMELLPGPILAHFVSDPEVTRYGIATLRIVAAGYVFYAWGMVAVQAFNGAGDTRTPTWLHVWFFWLFQVPLAAAAAYWTDLGAVGVIWSIPIAESLFAVASVILFRRGKWKTVVV